MGIYNPGSGGSSPGGVTQIVAGTGISVNNGGIGVVTVTNTAPGGGTIGGSIAQNQIAFGSAANTISGSNTLTWDNSISTFKVGDFLTVDTRVGSKLVVVGDNGTPSTRIIVNGLADIIRNNIYNGGRFDVQGIMNGTSLTIDDAAQTIVAGGPNTGLSIDNINEICSFGGNKANMYSDNTNTSFGIPGFGGIAINTGVSQSNWTVTGSSIQLQTISVVSGESTAIEGGVSNINLYAKDSIGQAGGYHRAELGRSLIGSVDYAGTLNDTGITITGATQLITAQTTGKTRMSFDFINEIYQIGNLAASGTRTKLYIDTTSGYIRYQDTATSIISDLKADSGQVSFNYGTLNKSASLDGNAASITLRFSDNNTGDDGAILLTDITSTFRHYDANTGSIDGAEAIAHISKLGNLQSTGNSTLITVNDTTEVITFAANGYNPTSADIPITVKVSLSSADILTLNSVPVQLVAAPGVGKIIVPLHVFCQYTFNTAAYATNTILGIFYDTLSANYMGGSNVINQTSDSASPLTIIGGANHSMLANKALKIKTDTGDPTAGSGTVDVYVTYKIVSL